MTALFYSHKTGSPPSKSLFLETVLPPTVEHLFASCTPLQLVWVASSKILLRDLEIEGNDTFNVVCKYFRPQGWKSGPKEGKTSKAHTS